MSRVPVDGAGASRLRLTFLVRSMERGGAERQLAVLAKGLRERGHDVTVVVFYPGGALEADLLAGGVRVRGVGKRGRWDVLPFLARLRKLLREERPHVLHAYLPTSNIVAAALRPAIPGVRVVWGQRASNMDVTPNDWVGHAIEWSGIVMSRLADLVIVNSNAGFAHAAAIGYPIKKLLVIPNGIDTDHFMGDRCVGRPLRAEWGIRDDERLVGLIARIDPIKAHETFLHAAAILVKQHRNVRFICVGDVADTQYADAMRALATELGLGDRVLWAGGRSDMRTVYNALDIACLSSAAEGFPNVVGEAMACGVPCVSTDVGDAGWLLADASLVAPPGDPPAFANRIDRLLACSADDLARVGHAARERVTSCCSVATLVGTTERVLAELVRRN